MGTKNAEPPSPSFVRCSKPMGGVHARARFFFRPSRANAAAFSPALIRPLVFAALPP